MSLGFLVDQIYLVSLGKYDPHAKNLRFFWFFYLSKSIGLHFKTAGPFHNVNSLNSNLFGVKYFHTSLNFSYPIEIFVLYQNTQTPL